MTTRRVFVYGGTRHNKELDDEYDEPITTTTNNKLNKNTIKPKIMLNNNNNNNNHSGGQSTKDSLSNSDYFSYSPKKRVDLKNDIDFDSSLYKDSSVNSILPKKANTIYVLRDDYNENEFVSPSSVVNYARKYDPQEKKAVNLSRTQSMDWIPNGKQNEKPYFHELKFDKRQIRRQMPLIRCEIDEPVLHEKPLPNRSVIHNGTIIYK